MHSAFSYFTSGFCAAGFLKMVSDGEYTIAALCVALAIAAFERGMRT